MLPINLSCPGEQHRFSSSHTRDSLILPVNLTTVGFQLITIDFSLGEISILSLIYVIGLRRLARWTTNIFIDSAPTDHAYFGNGMVA